MFKTHSRSRLESYRLPSGVPVPIPVHGVLTGATMRHFFSLPVIFCAIVLASKPAPARAGGEAKAKSTEPTPVLKGFDPVALTKGKEVAGDKSLDLVYKGFRYRFASAENRKLFEREPAR